MFRVLPRRWDSKMFILATACVLTSFILLLHRSIVVRQVFTVSQVKPSAITRTYPTTSVTNSTEKDHARSTYNALIHCSKIANNSGKPQDDNNVFKTFECVAGILKSVREKEEGNDTITASEKQFLFALHQNLTKRSVNKTVPPVPPESRVSQFLKRPVINPFNYKYLIQPKLGCSGRPLEVLFVVPTAPMNANRRHHVRTSQRGLYAKSRKTNSTLLFFVGKPVADPRGTIQRQIHNESRLHGDIVQADFFDEYENIRLKAMFMLKWVLTWCPNTTHVIRTDDDVRVKVFDVVRVMKETHKTFTDFVIGKRLQGDAPGRTFIKWHLSYSEYPEATFPPYVLGGLVGYPLTTIRQLYEAALRLKPIWLDDVFITGMCAAQMEIPVLSDPSFTFEHII